ncbi:hypothetical protein QQF64_029263 [Cirrhinus molitorella]|uniref:Uncharacterized protein n=1 Tax=Cirrhinus molitorella TaxID=172907 RepID=A0ABR3N8W7_9TELE
MREVESVSVSSGINNRPLMIGVACDLISMHCLSVRLWHSLSLCSRGADAGCVLVVMVTLVETDEDNRLENGIRRSRFAVLISLRRV